MKLLTISAAFLFTLTAQAQSASFADVAFLSGCWSTKDDGVNITESWTKTSGNVIMQGISQTKFSDKAVLSYEFLRIERRKDGTIAYTPYINGQQAKDFILAPNSQPDASSTQSLL